MKNIKYLILTLLISNIVFSQNSTSKEDYVIIYFKDSTTVKGKNLVHNYNTFNPSGIVKFTDTKKSKKKNTNQKVQTS